MPNDHLKIVFWNANGLNPKLNELSAFINQNKIDIVLIGETKLNPSTKIKIRNYHLYRTDAIPRPGSAASGGTAILIHRRIVHKQIPLTTTLYSTSIEISIGNYPTRFSGV